MRFTLFFLQGCGAGETFEWLRFRFHDIIPSLAESVTAAPVPDLYPRITIDFFQYHINRSTLTLPPPLPS